MKRILGILVSSLFLAACGGGGGNSGGAGAVPSTSTPALTQSLQRAVATQALATIDAEQIAVTYLTVFFSVPPGYVVAAARRGIRSSTVPAAAPTPPYSECNNGIEDVGVSISAVEYDEYEQTFYDAACTMLATNQFYDYTTTSSSSSSGTGNTTYYSRSGVADDYRSMTITQTGIGQPTEMFTFLASDAPSASAATTGTLALSCSVSQTNSESCGAAAVLRETVADIDVGSTLTFSAATPMSTSNTVTFAPSGSTQGVSGAYSSLMIAAGTFPAWTIANGQQVDATTFSSSLQFNEETDLTATSQTFTDTADGAAVSVISAGSPTVITGVVKQASTGSTAATFTTDTFGNGTITFENGQTATITNWRIID